MTRLAEPAIELHPDGRDTPAPSVQAPGTRSRYQGLGIAAVLGAAVLLLYYPTIGKLAAYWSSNDMYSYGFLVPFISLYLVWLRRDVLLRTPRVPSFAFGLPLLAAGLLLLVLGHLSSTNLIEELSLPVTVCAVVLLVLGTRMTRALVFPLAYLGTMVPFWDFLTNRLHEPFQLYSATLGVGALRLFGIPVYRDGIFIHLPKMTLEVADLCSGVNHLVAVLCIGVPITQLFVRRWPTRVFIVSSAVVIALLSNGLRVAMVSLFAYYDMRGPDGDVHGPFSLFRSLLISGIGFVVLFWLISRFADTTPGADTMMPALGAAARTTNAPMATPIAIVAAIAMVAGAAAFQRLHVVAPVPPVANLVLFPSAIGEWRVRAERPGTAALGNAGFDHAVSRSYTSPDGSDVELLVGYFERQEQGRELVGYRTSQLIGADGPVSTWTLPDGATVSDFTTTAKGVPYHVTYWYALQGTTGSRAYEAKWRTAWSSLVAGRTDGGVVVLRTRQRQGESVEATRARVRDFVHAVMVASRIYLPA
jgi:EpsI family protein